ncbi:MAG: ATPase, T2SS/T4P/T4SS family [Actinomycetota bacterium]|nr:ATPase, T2SS/T4P/T4SS family [Actinomycetota bacterium]
MQNVALWCDQVAQRVRDEVRALRLDPMHDGAQVQSLIERLSAEVVIGSAGHEEWEASVASDVAAVSQAVQHSICGFGPLQPFFDDDSVEEIWINDPGRVFVARSGMSELTPVVLTAPQVRDVVERMLRWSGRRLDLSQPFVDATLPDGSRLHVVIPDVTREHWAVNIRRFVIRPRSVHDLARLGTLSDHAARFLEASVISGSNIVVAGGTQAGKTTLLNALLGSVPARERIISCEEVFEVRCDHPDWVAMQTRDASLEGTGEIPLRRLVREALRMRPTRLIVGEVRQAESLDLLVAMNSGMPSMSTLHANSAREAVTKLCTLPLLAGQNIPGDFVVPTVASSVDLVVHTATDQYGNRRVREIAALTGRVESGTVEIASIFADHGSGLERGQGFPVRVENYRRHGFDVAEILSGDRALIQAAA